MRFTHRTRAALAALGGLVVLAALPVAATAHPGESGSLDRYGQRLSWKSCVLGPDDAAGHTLDAAGARCADVTVPLDYSRPRGRTITVAIARIPATDTAQRIGTIVVNEGGPADPVIDYLTDRLGAMGDVGARYDVVGVDPRFVGRNARLDCGWDTGTYVRSAGADRAGFDRMVAFERDLAEQCRQRAGRLLPYASTRNAARDMDVVRRVLGESRISYLGISYGTYLGEVYTAMFPGRTDRVVFDGVHDPERLAPWPVFGTEQPNEDALFEWAVWAAARDATYGLGATPEAVQATMAGIQEAAALHPLSVGTYWLDEHTTPIVVYGVLGVDSEAVNPYIADMILTLKQAADTGHAETDELLDELLPQLFTGDGSAYGSAQTAYLCADTPGPRDPEVFWHEIEQNRAAHPLFGPIVNNVTPCAFWPSPREQPTVVDNDIPALLVNATGDPRVPYDEALAMHTRWPSSRLVTLTGSSRHAVYGVDYGNACVNDTVNAYLGSGTLPASDLTCAAD